MKDLAALPRSRRRIALLLIVALALYWPLTFLATHLPVRGLRSSGMNLDKVFHFGSFGILGFLLTGELALRNSWHWKWAGVAILICAVYGVLDELTQIPVGRTADPWDWLADVLGATAGAIVAGSICQWVRWRNRRR